jgi:hypothetical protein
VLVVGLKLSLFSQILSGMEEMELSAMEDSNAAF